MGIQSSVVGLSECFEPHTECLLKSATESPGTRHLTPGALPEIVLAFADLAESFPVGSVR